MSSGINHPKSRIEKAFEGGKAFIAFITCGDPDLATTKAAVIEAARNGASLIELGIPFSDPTAEGPVIEAANMRALKGGVTTDAIFSLASELSQEVSVPLLFMTYANVVFSYGAGRFTRRCNEAGITGLILPDLPFEERDEFHPACKERGIDLVPLIAPTSARRVAMIAKEAEGFVYLVSSLGVTGMRKSITTDLDSIVSVIRENTDVPCAIGFGISTPEQAREMAAKADGVITGSAIVKIIEEKGRDAPPFVGEFVRRMKEAAREA